MKLSQFAVPAVLAVLVLLAAPASAATKGRTAMEPVAGARWRFSGPLGARIDRNVDRWLLRMPAANPGLLDMFRRRDRHLPYDGLVPWAGEFAGKYLISAVQACRMSGDPRLKPAVAAFVRDLVATQAPNGYLGPFPRSRELLGDCDLWGHYHCMLGLLMWHDDTGDRRAYACAIRAADLIAKVYGPGGRRPIEAGAANFNLSVLHVMADLYRRTGNAKYLEVAQRIVDDLPKDGDWFRGGLAGTDYCKLPASGSRWEALHILQGFGKLYEATGDARYRQALLSLWHSLRKLDRHPSGAFSTNEHASGTIYALGSIETCCSVAWMALTIDALRLTGDPNMADELELTEWNQALASQHPSGSWCTYDTPLNGVRAPSYEEIAFQYRPSAPELNCCSVNGPRTLGMLSEWAVMRAGDALAVNFYGPCRFDLPLPNGGHAALVQKTDYPVGDTTRIEVRTDRPRRIALRLRIPAWSAHTRVSVSGAPIPEAPKPGAYLTVDRVWRKGDAVTLTFEMTPRLLPGAGPDRGGRAAIHVGPLLLAFDAYYNRIETADLKPFDFRRLGLRRLPAARAGGDAELAPMAIWRMQTPGGTANLCDFASAGAHGTDYAAWLPASHVPPPATTLLLPARDATGKPSPILFRWEACGGPDDGYELKVARDPEFKQTVLIRKVGQETHAALAEEVAAPGDYYWQVVTVNADDLGTRNREGAAHFRVAADAPDRFFSIRQDGVILAAPLNGDPSPSLGRLDQSAGISTAPGRQSSPRGALAFTGPASCLRYEIPFFPERDYSVAAWVCPEGLPVAPGQIVSAWCRGGDDPLRVIVVGNEVFARIEGGGSFGTAGVPLVNARWTHIAAVKEGASLTLYVDGKPARTTAVPEYVRSESHLVGVGFNPCLGGDVEHFTGKIAEVALYARALSGDEIAKMAAAR